jgi:hypothetical protein
MASEYQAMASPSGSHGGQGEQQLHSEMNIIGQAPAPLGPPVPELNGSQLMKYNGGRGGGKYVESARGNDGRKRSVAFEAV